SCKKFSKMSIKVLTSKKSGKFDYWGNYDENNEDSIVIIYRCHDFFYDIDKFLSIISKIGPKLINPLDIVLWNINKKYLLDLQLLFTDNTIPTTIITNIKDVRYKNVIFKPLYGGGGYNVIHSNNNSENVI